MSLTSQRAPEGTTTSKGGEKVNIEESSEVLQLNDESYTEEEEKQVLQKLDMTLLPMMCIVFFFQYIDKQSLSYGSVFGLIPDLKLTPDQYSWCASIFYFGNLVAEYPFIYLMSRLPLTKLVGSTVFLWGAVCMCLAAPTNFGGFATVRFFLGFTEGAVSPAFMTITSIWYRKSEHAVRTAIWVSMNMVAQVIGCFLMYGIAKNTSLALAPWRVIFLVCGALTSAVGVMFYVLMPNGPREAWFLTAREKQVLALRMAKDREGGDKTSFSAKQLKEAATDPRAWFAFIFGVLGTMQSPVLTFATLVIKNIGYTPFETMLYTAPSGAVQLLALWIGVLGCWLFPRNRTLVALALIIPPLIGTILLLKLKVEDGWGLIISAWLASCIMSVMSPLLSLLSSNVKGNTKRAVVNCAFFIGFCAGCIASPQLWTKPPRYFSGVVTSLVTWCLLFVAILTYRFLCMRENAARDKAAAGSTASGNSGTDTMVVLDKYGAPKTDLTDKEDRRFRYSCYMPTKFENPPTGSVTPLDAGFSCNNKGATPASQVYSVKASDKVGLKQAYGGTGMQRPGPAQVYMSPVADFTTDDGSGDWYKVHQALICTAGSVESLRSTARCSWDED
ncbi:unnamed protein product [Clonostachys rosea]|uniref:Major facilitator superfamily (MFS) profile domain-containing protein n=1 Tax=Bionectria ochroleuca TaxID=29856 RepID=A0ABY6UQC5_BIOOC|nr:unnamed protein product [Clonostachys rosea]